MWRRWRRGKQSGGFQTWKHVRADGVKSIKGDWPWWAVSTAVDRLGRAFSTTAGSSCWKQWGGTEGIVNRDIPRGHIHLRDTLGHLGYIGLGSMKVNTERRLRCGTSSSAEMMVWEEKEGGGRNGEYLKDPQPRVIDWITRHRAKGREKIVPNFQAFAD